MKQLLSLALALLPCLAWAQYPSNGNQKITLGEQTTADGLFYRGLAADTTRKPSVDTMAYMLLDTTTNIMWHYKKQTNNAWLRLNLLPSDTASMLTPYIERGDTASMLTPYFRKLDTTNIKYVNTYGTQTVNGAKTFSSTVTASRFDPTSSSASGNGMYLPAANTLGFSTSGTEKMRLNSSGNLGLGVTPSDWSTIKAMQVLNTSWGASPNNLIIYQSSNIFFDGAFKYITSGFATQNRMNDSGVFSWLQAPSGNANDNISFTQTLTLDVDGDLGIATITPSEKLHVNGNARITGLANASNPVNVQVDVNGVLVRTSSIELKDDVQNLPYGLNEIMLLKPSKFNYKNKYKFGEGYDIGFIAEDVNDVIPEAVGTGVESDIFMDSVKLIPILTKAIQEQQALIKALEQRIINLENK